MRATSVAPQPSSVEVRLRLLEIAASCGPASPEALMALADRLKPYIYKKVSEIGQALEKAAEAGVPVHNPPKNDEEAVARVFDHLASTPQRKRREYRNSTSEERATRRKRMKELAVPGTRVCDIARELKVPWQTCRNDLSTLGFHVVEGRVALGVSI